MNRRLTYSVGDGRVQFITTGADVRVIQQELRELPLLRDPLRNLPRPQPWNARDSLTRRGSEFHNCWLFTWGRSQAACCKKP